MERSNDEEYPTLTLLDLDEKDFVPTLICSSKIEPSCEKAMTNIQSKGIESSICPTDILIDLEEKDPVPSSKKIFPFLQSQTVMAGMQGKGKEYIRKKVKYESIMDMSPIRLNYECDEQDVKPLSNPEQVSGGAQADCPTAILIDVPTSTKEDSSIPCCFSAVKSQLSPPTLRWKVPSPQSMSRISKEALKVIQDLNSSNLLDEGLLDEEIMPIPMNLNSDENSDDDGLLNQKPSDSVKREMDVISKEVSKIDLKSSDIKEAIISSKDDSLTQSCFEIVDSKLDTYSTTSENLSLPELQSSSFDNSEVFISDRDITVFIEENPPSQGKENMQEKKDQVLPSKTVIKTCVKVPHKISVSVKGTEKCPTLKNISNVKNVSSRYLPGIKKRNTTLDYITPQSPEKRKLKKTTSADTRTQEPKVPKGIKPKYSHSFQYQNRSSISFQEPKSTKLMPSVLPKSKSSSTNVKPSLIQMKTPAKSRYSLSTSSEERSIKPTPRLPLLAPTSTVSPWIPHPSVPRFTPQAISGNRLSFSKSWQQPGKSSSKGIENQGSMFTSTARNRRFSSKLKLPSSLPSEQDKKLARALFPSKPSFK